MRIFRKLAVFIIGSFIIVFSAYSVAPYLREVLLNLGVFSEEISIAGTGSMYPTFARSEGKTEEIRAKETVALPHMRRYPGGVDILGRVYSAYTLMHGDIVQFENDLVHKISLEKYGEEAGFVKRVIGLPGDTIELRDGFVHLNGQGIDEPYTAKPRSSYGGDFLEECRTVTVPSGKLFVMGDNRKASLDSRFKLGFINESDVHHVLPIIKQDEYRRFWRDTSSDKSLANTSTLDVNQFIGLINDKRSQNKLPALKYNVKLSESAKLRGQVMINTDDFSTEATKSGKTLESTLTTAGYRNILSAEVFTKGYYEADELLENFSEFPETKKILFSSDYQDIGVASELGDVNSCPVQVIVVHLGGYVPPNYKQSDIDSWSKLTTELEKVYPSWKQLQNADGIDLSKLSQLLYLFEKRIQGAKSIVSRMKANQWLTDEEKDFVKLDRGYNDQMQTLIDALNKH